MGVMFLEKAMNVFVENVLKTEAINLTQLENIFQKYGYREDMCDGQEHILVLRLDEIGDTILNSAFLRELRRNVLDAWITLVVRDSTYNIMELCPYADEVLPFPSFDNEIHLTSRMPIFAEFCRQHLWKHRYTKCFCPRWDVDIQFSLMLGYMSGAKRRIGYSESVSRQKSVTDKGWDVALTNVVVAPPYIVHEVEKNLYLLKALGYAVDDSSIEIWLSDRDIWRAMKLLAFKTKGKRLIAVTIGSREHHKSYPPELMAEALNTLAREDFVFALLGGHEESGMGDKIISKLPKGIALNLAGKISLRESCAVISISVLLIGNDTGLTHAAAALRVPVVEINCHPQNSPVFTWSFYARFFPWKVRCVVLRPLEPAEGCKSLTDEISQVKGCCSKEAHCIRGILPESIVDAVKWLLG